MLTTTPLGVIAEARTWREKARPAECDGRDPCWVEKPYEAISSDTSAPTCVSCNGKIGKRQ